MREFASERYRLRQATSHRSSREGQKDRAGLLPSSLESALNAHLAHVKSQHERDLSSGAGSVELPDALATKYANARRQWAGNGPGVVKIPLDAVAERIALYPRFVALRHAR
jgi:hypothetical protein